jgi:hypothetical protein
VVLRRRGPAGGLEQRVELAVADRGGRVERTGAPALVEQVDDRLRTVEGEAVVDVVSEIDTVNRLSWW